MTSLQRFPECLVRDHAKEIGQVTIECDILQKVANERIPNHSLTPLAEKEMVDLIISCISHEIGRPLQSPLNALYSLQEFIRPLPSGAAPLLDLAQETIRALHRVDLDIANRYNEASDLFRRRTITAQMFLDRVLEGTGETVGQAEELARRLAKEVQSVAGEGSETAELAVDVRRMILALTRVLPAIGRLAELERAIEVDKAVSIKATCEDAVRFLATSGGAPVASISYPLKATSLPADRGLFFRFVTNVLTNAFKYTSDPGNVQVRIENQRLMKGEIASRLRERRAQPAGASADYAAAPDDWEFYLLAIHDNGVGISDLAERKKAAKLFHRVRASFRSPSRAPTEQFGSLDEGVGLAVCRLICSGHRGGLFLGDSGFGEGLGVYSTWPANAWQR